MRYQVFNEKSSTQPVFTAPWRWLASWYVSTVALRFQKCRMIDSKSGETSLDWARGIHLDCAPAHVFTCNDGDLTHTFIMGTTGKGKGAMENPSIEQVKALDGRIFAMLNSDEEAVLNFYRDHGRKFGVSVSIINEADPEELAQASSRQQADHILKIANSRVRVTVAP